MKKFKNRITGFLLAFIALIAVSVAGVFKVQASQTAHAASESDLVFSPAMREDGYSVAPVNKDISGVLVIPSTYNGKNVVQIYTTVGSYAFYGCSKLISVVIPDSIKSIGERAFGGCSGLTSVTLSNSLTRIERSTFLGCKGLTSIVIPEGVTSIGVGAFESCSNLKDISLPDSLTYLNDNVFGACSSLTEITLPSGLTGIGRYCFSSCSSLKTITFKGSSEQWAAVKKEKDAVPSSIKIVCLGDVANEISADIENDGVTNESVTVTYSGYSVSGYYSKGDSSYPSTSSTTFTDGTTFTEEGYYRVEARNAYADPAVLYFTIDKTAPTGTLNNVTDGGYTNKNVTFTWTDKEATATLNENAYTSGQTISAEGAHTIVLTDRAGNSTTYTFIIDKTAPTGTLNNVTNGGYTNKDVTFTWMDAGATATLNGSAYTSGRKISAEGAHTIVLTDRAGNSTTYTFTIDKTAPVIDAYNIYTNAEFTMTAKDKYCSIGAWEYRLDSGEIKRSQTQSLTLGGNAKYNGVWSIRVIDELGNTSSWVNVNHVYRETFGNSEDIYNSFFVPSYYVVTLSQKNYTSCFGAYTFADYTAALNFAVNKEWECRVIELDGGKSWNYVNPTNENTRQIYTDRAELDEVIDKYARKNIGDRKVMSKNGATLNNPTDGNGVTRADALTHQLFELPGLLSAYSEYRYMLALPTYSLTTPKTIVDGNKATATIQFISDGISLRIGAEKPLSYGDKISTALNAAGEQGWYLITECDVCGNVEKYLIFVDVQQPELYASVTYGNHNKELIDFNQTYIDENTETMRYIEFDISSLTDNIDDYVMVSIEGRNAGVQYVWGDEIPVLNYENGYYGAYTITAYDRSRNALEFTVYIAGEDPSLRYSSLMSETACTFTIQVNDSFNEITDIKFYKIHFEGTEERLYTDTFDTPVNAQNLVYKMNVGGKYVFEFSDLYGRIVRTNPVFYMKGLPSATLRGVKDGGLTKNDVSVIYDNDATCELFTLQDGEWTVTELYETSPSISTTTIGITAGKETTAIYKVLLYKTDDRNLFTEYTFEIDGIPPAVQIFTEGGEEIVPETVTTQNFFITWQESGYKAYYKKQGAISELQYSKESVITSAGTYVFTVYDNARNELSFNVTLDNVVSYTLGGAFTLLDDGSYITRNNFTFTVTEPYSELTIEASNGLTVVNGQKLDTDGTYLIKAKDMYGNSMSLTLIVDKLPPVPVILTEDGDALADGARTPKAFKVLCEEENIAITFAIGKDGYSVYDGEIINTPGTYTFRLTDRVGNAAVVTVTIDREVTYRIDGTYILLDETYCSRTWLLVVPTEAVSQFRIETEDGGLIDTTKRISDEGIYKAVIVDVAGNEVEIPIVIDKTAPTVKAVTESGKELNGKEITNEAFRFICDEEGATLVYSYNGSSNIAYDSELLSDPGKYTYTVTDKLGNSGTGIIAIDREVQYRIDGSFTIFDGVYYSRAWLLITPSEEVSEFTVEYEDGSLIDTTKRITAEGSYTVIITDVANNTLRLALVIDKTAPTVKVITESGKELNGGAVNEAFKITCVEQDAVIEYSVGTEKYVLYDGTMISAEGLYTFRITDRIGNVSELSVLVNFDVLYAVEGAYTFKNGKYYSKSWLQVTPLEEVAAFIIEDESGNLIDTEKRISAEGDYTVTIIDAASNTLKLALVIDKTAPTVQVLTESGVGLENGSTTGERFKVVCAETDSTVVYGYNNSGLVEYPGSWLEEQGKYLFTVSDFLGNAAELVIYIDTSVALTVNGTYVTDADGSIISRSWLSVTADEDLKKFVILGSDGTNVDVNGRITEEGLFEVYAEDVYGNVRKLTLVIDKTAPEIILDGVAIGGATKEPVTVKFNDYTEAYYRFNSGDIIAAVSGSEFTAEGSYLITARDLVGNTVNASFNIDKHVDVSPSVSLSDGCIITGSVSFKFNEPVTATLYINGAETPYLRGEIAAVGEYSLIAVDEYGNEKTYRWSILPAKAREYAFYVTPGIKVTIERNGEIIPAPFEGDTLKLTENGQYALRFDAGYSVWFLALEVDNVKPEVHFENTRTSVIISEPNKKGVNYTLYRDGVKTSFNLVNSAELTQTGDYRLICEDELGNVTEYVFELHYLSDISIVLIVVLSALAVAGIVTVIVMRFRRKIF